MHNSRNTAVFFTLVIEKVDLYINIAKEIIRYSKLSWDTIYRKLVKSTQAESDNNE